jgi:hypothetical protein
MDDQAKQVEARPGDAERLQEPGATALGRGGVIPTLAPSDAERIRAKPRELAETLD